MHRTIGSGYGGSATSRRSRGTAAAVPLTRSLEVSLIIEEGLHRISSCLESTSNTVGPRLEVVEQLVFRLLDRSLSTDTVSAIAGQSDVVHTNAQFMNVGVIRSDHLLDVGKATTHSAEHVGTRRQKIFDFAGILINV